MGLNNRTRRNVRRALRQEVRYTILLGFLEQ